MSLIFFSPSKVAGPLCTACAALQYSATLSKSAKVVRLAVAESGAMADVVAGYRG
jgi:hypothetical protein